jgi:hypothetical protein
MAKLRIPAMVVLFSAAAVTEAFRLTSLSSLNNADIWWHLSAGLWMLQHHALPHFGIFSQASAQPWIASSWAYELSLAVAYKLVGLRAIPWLLMCFKAALAVLTFLLAGGMRGRFWLAIGLSVVSQYILGSAQLGPAYFSIVFFGIELLLLLDARRSGSLHLLWWLPALFLLWANLHVEFVYGIVVLVFFLPAVAFEKASNDCASLRIGQLGSIVGASLVPTLVTPYLYRAYAVFFKTTFNSANKYLPEFQALGFRQPQDYLLMLLAMSAFLVLGLRRSRDAFQSAVLIFSLSISFYSQRDIWMVVLAALAVIGQAVGREETSPPEERAKFSREPWIAISTALAIVVLIFLVRVPRNREELLAKVGQSYPVAASEYIRSHLLQQPLFNAYEWGGFLTWYLPNYPVAIDSRADLYGPDVITEYSKVMNAEVPYTEYPAVANAQTVVLPNKANLAAAIGSLPSFQVAYSDEVSVVLTRRSTP